MSSGASTMTDENAISETERLELKRLELERYKAWLDYRKFIWASVVAAITIAAIPLCFSWQRPVLNM